MDVDLLDLYARSSEWAAAKVAGAAGEPDAPTPCERWDVRALTNHMLDTQRYFVRSARGEDATMPASDPPDLAGDDPTAAFQQARDEALRTFGADGVVEKTGASIGIAASDALLHGWDLAVATGQDDRMPDDLAEALYGLVHGRFTDEQRAGIFGPEVPVGPDASPQDRYLAYTGRNPQLGGADRP